MRLYIVSFFLALVCLFSPVYLQAQTSVNLDFGLTKPINIKPKTRKITENEFQYTDERVYAYKKDGVELYTRFEYDSIIKYDFTTSIITITVSVKLISLDEIKSTSSNLQFDANKGGGSVEYIIKVKNSGSDLRTFVTGEITPASQFIRNEKVYLTEEYIEKHKKLLKSESSSLHWNAPGFKNSGTPKRLQKSFFGGILISPMVSGSRNQVNITHDTHSDDFVYRQRNEYPIFGWQAGFFLGGRIGNNRLSLSWRWHAQGFRKAYPQLIDISNGYLAGNNTGSGANVVFHSWNLGLDYDRLVRLTTSINLVMSTGLYYSHITTEAFDQELMNAAALKRDQVGWKLGVGLGFRSRGLVGIELVPTMYHNLTFLNPDADYRTRLLGIGLDSKLTFTYKRFS